MNIKNKTALIHMIHIWTSSIINMSIPSISESLFNTSIPKIMGILAVFVLTVISAIGHISYEMHVGGVSKSSLIFDYICVLILSCIIIVFSYARISKITAIIVFVALVIEISIIPIIAYRYRIMNKIKAMFKK